MYLTELKLERVKLIASLDATALPFLDEDGGPRRWTVLVGQNGLCKTTVLQAVALAASGVKLAEKLASAGDLRDKRYDEPAYIEARFAFSERHHEKCHYPHLPEREDRPPTLLSTLTVKPGQTAFFGGADYLHQPPPSGDDDPLVTARASGLAHWFVAGYGVARSLPLPLSTQPPDDPVHRRLEPLFGQVSPRGTGFADIFQDDVARAYVWQLRKVLIEGGLLPGIEGLEMRGAHGVRSQRDLVEAHRFVQTVGNDRLKLPARLLSHGYQATIAWIADLIGQVFLEAGGSVDPEEMEGLVLIDELDLHLHPAWQVRLVDALRTAFPRMQFVVTTHSPMLLPAFERHELYVMRQDDEGNVTAEMAPEDPRLLTGSELFEAFFDLKRRFPAAIGEALHRYSALASNPFRSDEEDTEMQALAADLDARGVRIDAPPASREALP